jgi:hypothetical protein
MFPLEFYVPTFLSAVPPPEIYFSYQGHFAYMPLLHEAHLLFFSYINTDMGGNVLTYQEHDMKYTKKQIKSGYTASAYLMV